jgi:hypothetical protein
MRLNEKYQAYGIYMKSSARQEGEIKRLGKEYYNKGGKKKGTKGKSKRRKEGRD